MFWQLWDVILQMENLDQIIIVVENWINDLHSPNIDLTNYRKVILAKENY